MDQDFDNKKVLIFTDMDGSLLDHDSYSHTAADALLQQLEEKQVAVIPATSKTSAELLQLREELHNRHPFIAENGAAVYIPDNYFAHEISDTHYKQGFYIKAFTETRAYWQSLITPLQDEFAGCFTTFKQLDISNIMELTGLDQASATRAAKREYGEPIAWQGTASKKRDFIRRIQELGARVLQGGRFIHVSGKCDKGQALKWLADCYQETMPDVTFHTLAIGDSQNDIAMLEAADMALIIRSPVHDMPVLKRQNNYYSSKNTGPEGWVEGVEHLLGSSINIEKTLIVE